MAKRNRSRRESDEQSVAVMDAPVEATPKAKGATRSVHAFAATVDIGTVAVEKSRLEGSLAAAGDLELDGSQIERVDAAFLQLLAALFRQGIETGKTVRWAGTSAALRDSARILGLTRAIGLESN